MKRFISFCSSRCCCCYYYHCSSVCCLLVVVVGAEVGKNSLGEISPLVASSYAREICCCEEL